MLGRRVIAMLLVPSAALWGCKERSEPRAETSRRAEAPAPALSSLASVATCTGETELVPGIPGSPGHLVPDTVNPNGASELALLMRRLRDDLEGVRGRVLAGERARIPDAHHRIRCAWPTVPGERNAAFDALAVEYLIAVDAYNARGDRAAYEAVVDRCVRCHESACTGALAAIVPLRLEGPASE